MQTPEDRLEEGIVARLAAQATGQLEAWADKRRWGFFFREGALVGTKSNLKSESEESLRRSLGTLTAPELLQVQATRRLVNAAREPGVQWGWKEGAEPPVPAPVDAASALFEAVRELRTEAELRASLEPLLAGFPRMEHPVQSCGAGPALEAYLDHLDGARPGQDVVEFAPAEPKTVLIAMWLGWRLGWLRGESEAAMVSPVVTMSASPVIPPARPPAGPATPIPSAAQTAAGGMDLDALFAEGLAQTAAPTPPPAPLPAAAADPAPAERLQALSASIRNGKHPWEILGQPWDASAETFRGAYMRLARDLHPDRYVSSPADTRELATELFDRVREAWETLGDEPKRRAYIDRHVHGKKTEEELALEQVQAFMAAETEFKRGLSAYKAGRVVDAHPMFKSAYEKAPGEIEFSAYLGYTSFYLQRERDPAQSAAGFAMLKEAVDRNAQQERKHDDLWVLLARAYREKGDLNLARRTLVHVIKMNAANAEAVRLLRRMEEEETDAKNAAKQSASLLGKVSGFFTSAFKKKKDEKGA